MTPENFVYWLNGYIELANPTTMNEVQVQEIKNHLGLVLRKVTPTLPTLKDLDKEREKILKYISIEKGVQTTLTPGFPPTLPEGVSICAAPPGSDIKFCVQNIDPTKNYFHKASEDSGILLNIMNHTSC